MASYNKFQPFLNNAFTGAFNFTTDQNTVALTNTEPAPTANNLSNIVEISSYANCSSRDIPLGSSSQTGGIYKLVLDDLTLTAINGAIPQFQWVVVYNSTSAGGLLIAWFDYGSPLDLQVTETLTLNFDGTNGLFTAQ